MKSAFSFLALLFCLSLAAISQALAYDYPAPRITVPTLFSEVILEPVYQGWQVAGVSPLTYWPQSDRRQERLAQMATIEAFVLTYTLNTKPVRVTAKNAAFFEGLSAEVPRDGTRMAYKYVFFPKSVVSPEDSSEPGEPIYFYLLREVPQGTKKNVFQNPPSPQAIAQTLKRHQQAFDCYYSACYLRDHGQFAMARTMLQMSADFGNPYAQYEWGLYLQATQKELEARVYFKMAADQGHSSCQFLYAQSLVEGVEGDTDFPTARTYFQLAAAQGDPRAQVIFASMCAEGEGGAIDLVLARMNYKLAADQGNPVAQRVYAHMLKTGQGGSVNLRGAIRYYRKLAENGDPAAACALEGLNEELAQTQPSFDSGESGRKRKK